MRKGGVETIKLGMALKREVKDKVQDQDFPSAKLKKGNGQAEEHQWLSFYVAGSLRRGRQSHFHAPL